METEDRPERDRPALHRDQDHTGEYFAGMARKAEAGELHMDRTRWKPREDKSGKGARAAELRRFRAISPAISHIPIIYREILDCVYIC